MNVANDDTKNNIKMCKRWSENSWNGEWFSTKSKEPEELKFIADVSKRAE